MKFDKTYETCVGIGKVSCLVLEKDREGGRGEENCRCDCLARCQRDWGMTGMLGALKKALNPSNNGRGAVKSRQKARKYKYVNT